MESILKRFMQEHDVPYTEQVKPQPDFAPTIWCAVCHDQQVEKQDDICPRCQQEKAQGYAVRTLTGRCANGAERDHGILAHAIALAPEYGDRVGQALCGAKPGRRSVGWSLWTPQGNTVTCTRCLKKLERRCSLCKGSGTLRECCSNIACPQCNGKGYRSTRKGRGKK